MSPYFLVCIVNCCISILGDETVNLTKHNRHPQLFKFSLKNILTSLKYMFLKTFYDVDYEYITLTFYEYKIDDTLNEKQKDIAVMYNDEIEKCNKITFLYSDWNYYNLVLREIIDVLVSDRELLKELFLKFSTDVLLTNDLKINEHTVYCNKAYERYERFIIKYLNLQRSFNNFRLAFLDDMSIEIIFLFYLQFQRIEKDLISDLPEIKNLFRRIDVGMKKIFIWRNNELMDINVKKSITYFIKYYGYILKTHRTRKAIPLMDDNEISKKYFSTPNVKSEPQNKTKEFKINGIKKVIQKIKEYMNKK